MIRSGLKELACSSSDSPEAQLTGVKLPHMDHHAHQIICAGPAEFRVADIQSSAACCVREHVESKGELDGGVDLGRLVSPAIVKLEPLCGPVSMRTVAWLARSRGKLTLSCIDSTLGSRAMLLSLRACCMLSQFRQRYSHLSDLMYSSSRHSCRVRETPLLPFLPRLWASESTPKLRSRKDSTALVTPPQF